MKIGVLGTGVVGSTIATKLVQLGHGVTMGAREVGNEHAQAWVASAGAGASEGTFAAAAGFGELLFNCTSGMHSLEALESAGAESLAGKVLVDVANPLDFSQGMPPTLAVSNTDSLGEQIQRGFPDVKVVKSLNTVNADVMVDPAKVPGRHTIFMCGDDEGAKQTVQELLESFGWAPEQILDLGGIAAARGTEMYLPLWLALYGTLGTGHFNIDVVHGD
jgi:8-hydroxy-5-deazaflavin:NADPH oxidoreductase